MDIMPKLRTAGFRPVHLGGGCMALGLDFGESGSVIVTDETDGVCMPESSDWLIGVHPQWYICADDEHSRMIGSSDGVTFADALITALASVSL